MNLGVCYLCPLRIWRSYGTLGRPHCMKLYYCVGMFHLVYPGPNNIYGNVALNSNRVACTFDRGVYLSGNEKMTE